MPPWEQIEDQEVRLYMDAAVFFMVTMGGMDPVAAWRKVERLQPKSPPGTMSYELFFHEAAYDLAMFLSHGESWWERPGVETRPREPYIQYERSLDDGSWQALKQRYFPD
jgi:hypothetical protein